jgi:hypothetical protein
MSVPQIEAALTLIKTSPQHGTGMGSVVISAPGAGFLLITAFIVSGIWKLL